MGKTRGTGNLIDNTSGTNTGDQSLSGYQTTSGKDATGGYAGLTLFKINFKNALDTFISFFTNANTAARTYTFQNRDGTIADDTDLGLKAPYAKYASVTGSNVTTTSATAADVTGLSIAVAANKIYRIVVQLWIGCDNTGGVRFAINGPAGAALSGGVWNGSGSAGLIPQTLRASALGSLSSGGANSFHRVSGTAGSIIFIGHITISSTAGNVTIQFASTTATQTSTVYIGSTFDLTEVQP